MKPSGVIYRLGRKPDPWAPPDWASAGPDGTFGNRFDTLTRLPCSLRGIRAGISHEIRQLFSSDRLINL